MAAKLMQERMTVVSQREVAQDIYELVLRGRLVEEMQVAGQFLQVRVPSDSLLLRRPISISSWDKCAGTCTLLYRIGDTTSGTWRLSALTEGQTVDVLGPLGQGFDLTTLKVQDHVLVIGGGIGVPPLFELTKQLSERGCKITVGLGFASKAVKVLDEDFAKLKNVEVCLATDDGSFGERGTVGLLLDEFTFKPDAVFACGAPAMLKIVAEKFDRLTNVQLSLEARMACGIGACYACVVRPAETHAGHARVQSFKVCEDGPVFQGKEVEL